MIVLVSEGNLLSIIMVSVNMICTSTIQAMISQGDVHFCAELLSVNKSQHVGYERLLLLVNTTQSDPSMPFPLIVSHEVMKSPLKRCHTCLCQTPHFSATVSGRLNMSASYSWSEVSCSRTWCLHQFLVPRRHDQC